jgi:hypothetical protein
LDDLTKRSRDFIEAQEDLTTRIGEVQAAIDLAIKQGYSPMGSKIQGLQGNLEDLEAEWDTLADEQELAGKRMILSMLEQAMMADGVLEPREREALIRLGVNWGIYSDTAIAELAEAEAAVAGYIAIINAIPTGKTFTLTVNQSGQITIPGYEDFTSNQPATDTPEFTTPGGRGGQDVGGWGHAGGSYMIGAGAQPEAFTPSTTGTFTPRQELIDYNRLARAIRDAMMDVGG